MPLFSVVIPVYNRAALIQRTIESFLNQPFADFELILVDDGSTDDTAAMLSRYGDRVQLLRQSNSGPGAARNLGARHATGDYLVMFDSDDLQFPWSLATYKDVLDQTGRPAFIVGCPFVFRDEADLQVVQPAAVQIKRFDDYFAFLETRPREWGWWGNSSFVVRRDVFESSGGYTSERVGSDDCDLALRIGQAKGFVQLIAPFTFAYRAHAESISQAPGAFARNVWHLIRTEKRSLYPGGKTARAARRHLVAMFARPASLKLQQAGETAEAWRLFRATLGWNLSLGRVRYLAAFPIKGIAASAQRMLQRPSPGRGKTA